MLYCSKRAATNSTKKIFLLVSKISTSKEHTSAGPWSLSDPAEDREKKGVGGMRELVAVVFHWLHLTVDAHSGSSFLHDWNISKGSLWGRFSAIFYCAKSHWISLVVRELEKALLSLSDTQLVSFFIPVQKFAEVGSQIPELEREYRHLQTPFTL